MGKKAKVGKTRKDKFYQLAKETGFRSRAAFKLIQLNRKFGFLQNSQVCIDLCAAPGGWMQVAKQNMPVSSIVIGVDLYPIRPITGCIGLVEDITTDKCRQSLRKELQQWKADVVLHDGAPNVGRNWLYDAYQQICLTLQALKLGTLFLKKDGWFITKVFRSKDYNALLWVLKQLFKKVHATKPSASRKESAEIFVVCQSYLAPDRIDPKMLDPKFVFEELELTDSSNKVSLLHPDKQKRVKAEGYTDSDIAIRNDLKASVFMKADNGLVALQNRAKIVIDDERIAQHPKTTTEILECCQDIKVLGRKDIKGLLAWWKTIKEDLFKVEEEVTNVIEEESNVQKPMTQDEIEDMEDEELQKEISSLAADEQKDLKRKRKKTQKVKSKLQEKMNLNMVIKGDEGPREEAEQGIFELRNIQTQEELDGMLDVTPDFDVEPEENDLPKLPKYKKYDKDDKRLDDDANYENDDEPEISNDEESNEDLDRQDLGLSGDDDDDDDDARLGILKGKKKKRNEHPLIKSGDFRDKDTKRQQRVQLWFEKSKLQNIHGDDDEDLDLNCIADEYKNLGVDIVGEQTDNNNNGKEGGFGKKAKRRARHTNGDKSSSSSGESSYDSDSDVDEEHQNNAAAANISKDSKAKKIRLNEEELTLGALMIKGQRVRRELIDGAWNRYAFNDENLPSWFVQEESVHMKRPIPISKELAEEYQRKQQELNVRPIKKVMEATARKKRRAVRRLDKAKKQAEKIMENADATSQEKAKQLQKVYKKAQEKKKEVTYVVAKKYQAGKRMRRPPGVKGRYRVVDPRQKKDKRSMNAKSKRKRGSKK